VNKVGNKAGKVVGAQQNYTRDEVPWQPCLWHPRDTVTPILKVELRREEEEVKTENSTGQRMHKQCHYQSVIKYLLLDYWNALETRAQS